ncbi:hypothetical protein [Rhizobium leguminosarum]|uniref:hypothetical protein n=1 Tax=Rhizobium leguminosarum TaxID=384 RepID=UPI0010326670|nr:hypothetical protein [Rhizobium leguminosarum]TBH00369.1 hypothetical protein ELG70_01345 [Rhizobium leguminosarum]TBH65098.1 hypothetical protein ELG61_01355 [Rhizobium leguminosarum]
MTTHAAIKTANRTALPRALLGRRPIRKSEYQFAFEMGELVTLLCTSEQAVIVARLQILDCIDEYVIEIVDADCDPLQVLEFQIA